MNAAAVYLTAGLGKVSSPLAAEIFRGLSKVLGRHAGRVGKELSKAGKDIGGKGPAAGLVEAGEPAEGLFGEPGVPAGEARVLLQEERVFLDLHGGGALSVEGGAQEIDLTESGGHGPECAGLTGRAAS